MSELRRVPRRPAILSAVQAEAIVGDEDPAEASVLAHTSAWAMLGVEDGDFTREAIERLRAAVRSEGADFVAELWSRSPDFTLPGALWRLYLFVEWYRRDTAGVQARYALGVGAQRLPGLERPLRDAPLPLVIDEAEAVLGGTGTEDALEDVLVAVARAMRIIAAGEEEGSGAWIEDPRDPLAYPVTTRGKALVLTARELERAATEAHVGTLN